MLAARAFVEALTVRGLSHCVICPGSRSAPLTMALAASGRVKSWVFVDERSAGYFAQGIAKASGFPAAVVCTSGTAAANLLPAVVEAANSATPLLVLTADRPSESRDSGSLQTIDQIKLFGSFPRWYHEMEIPSIGNPRLEAQFRGVAGEAMTRAVGPPGGPIHLNFPFREPFVPGPGAIPDIGEMPVRRGPRSIVKLAENDLDDLVERLSSSRRGVVVAGPQPEVETAHRLVSLASVLGWPLLADPLSQIRTCPANGSLVIDSYDLILRSEVVGRSLQPDLTLRFGMTPTSRALMNYLAAVPAASQISIRSNGLANDPGRQAGTVIEADGAAMASELVARIKSARADSAWTESWRRLQRTARHVVDATLAENDRLSEPRTVSVLARELPIDALLWSGSSMPLRDLDDFFPARAESVLMLGNRGANGIDGVVSSALGAGAALGRRVVLLIGDLSFHHDLNGLAAARKYGLDATIVLMNNDGGGIFHFLPQVKHVDVFEEFFATPTGLDFRLVVEMFGGCVVRPESAAGLAEALRESWNRPGLTVIEVRTERSENRRLHEKIWALVVEAVEGAVSRPAKNR